MSGSGLCRFMCGTLVGCGMFFGGLAFAQEKPLDVPVRMGSSISEYRLNADGSSTELHSWSMTVLKPSAIDWAKRATVTYSHSIQKAEILAAYTTKTDGRRIDVRKDSFQLNSNSGRDAAAAYSDYNTISLVFPEVAVGDTVSLQYRVEQSEPIFPGHVSWSQEFSRQAAHDDVKVVIDYPAAMAVKFEGRGMAEQRLQPAADRQQVIWTWRNPLPLRSDRRDYSVYDPDVEVGFAFTSFGQYREIAEAYGKRAIPKAQPNERVHKLAAEIVAGKSGPRAEARALYDWVATKISYAGNCVGVGAVVPRDLDFVLDNRIGDCKDHATLLQALLKARGIESTQALVNAGSVFRLPKLPLVSSVNHVINYLPAFDLYVDSTSNSTPFGMLPPAVRGKPVLHVEGFREGTMTPSPALATEQRVLSRLKISKTGTLSGTVEVSLKGDAAAGMREWVRNASREETDDYVKNMFRSGGLVAAGSLQLPDARELLDHYQFSVRLDKVEKFIRTPGSGALHLYPLFGGAASVGHFVRDDAEEGEPVEVACGNGSSIEEYRIELPASVKVLSVPDAVRLVNSVQRYAASYSVRNGVLIARRALHDSTATSVCGPSIMKEYRTLARQVLEDLKTPVLYR